jgi:hypothetical protein
MDALFALDSYQNHGPVACLVTQCLIVCLVIRLCRTAFLVGKMEQFAVCYHKQREQLVQYVDLGPMSTPVDVPPPRQGVSCRLGKRKSSLLSKVFTYKKPTVANLSAAQTAILSLMNEATMVETELSAILAILQVAGAGQGRPCELKGPNLKHMLRAQQKSKLDYENDHYRLLDLARGAVICDTFEDVRSVFQKLQVNELVLT